MIAVDSSTLIAYIQGDPGPDVDRFESAIDNNQIVLPPPVITDAKFGRLANGSSLRTLHVQAWTRSTTNASLEPVTVIYSANADQLQALLTMVRLGLAVTAILATLLMAASAYSFAGLGRGRSIA